LGADKLDGERIDDLRLTILDLRGNEELEIKNEELKPKNLPILFLILQPIFKHQILAL